MKVLIIGANGKIGRLLCEKLKATTQYEPVAVVRKLELVKFFEDKGISVVIGSIEDSEDEIGNLIKGYGALVFTAGSGGKTGYDKTLSVDLDGAIKVIRAAEMHELPRFIMVSAAHADDREFWDKSSIKPYYIAKHYADQELVESPMNYTIVRPVRLTDETEEGKVRLRLNAGNMEPEIPRVAVAEVISRILEDEHTYRKIIEMSKGEDAIADALKKLS